MRGRNRDAGAAVSDKHPALAAPETEADITEMLRELGDHFVVWVTSAARTVLRARGIMDGNDDIARDIARNAAQIIVGEIDGLLEVAP